MVRVGLLHPGEMGAAVGRVLLANGHTVSWAAEGRSAASRARADAAGLHAVATVATLLASVDIVISLCPPGAALELATDVAALGFAGTYVDANAVSPALAREIAGVIGAAGGSFLDGDVIGGPPVPGSGTRVYFSGQGADRLAQMLDPFGVDLGPDPTAASALKMCYAAWTKGTWALLAALRAVALELGVEDTLLAEWERSQPGLAERSERAATTNARKAWRFAPELAYIADTFESVGLPGGFARAASEVYRRLDGFKDVTDPPLADVLAALTRPAETAALPRPAEPAG